MIRMPMIRMPMIRMPSRGQRAGGKREALGALGRRRLAEVLVAGALLAVPAGCGKDRKKTSGPGPSPRTVVPGTGSRAGADAPEGLVFRLEPGQSPSGGRGRAPVAKATPLSPGATRALLARVARVGARPSDVKRFAFRSRSLPPPRTGRRIAHSFPPRASAPPPPRPRQAGGKKGDGLRVVRVSPKGDVKMAPKVSVTFSAPMVAVTSHADTVAGQVPVKMQPRLDGVWRWIGTRTLLFEPKVRLPMATTFRLQVPAGTRSVTGQVLAKAETWTFSTPAPRLLYGYPRHGPVPLAPVLFLLFDQKIDPDAVLATVRLQGGGKTWSLRRATRKQIQADPEVRRLVKRMHTDKHGPRWVAAVPEAPLAPGTRYTVSVGPGTPSEEGPRKTAKAQTVTFRTYDPLEMKWQSCTLFRRCRPPARLSMEFNNPLDEERFDPKAIQVRPEISGAQIRASGSYLSISGKIKADTIYHVTLPATLRDIFGQTLGQKREVGFVIGEARPMLRAQYGRMSVLDPKGDKKFHVFSMGYTKLRVFLYRVAAKDWSDYLSYRRNFPYPPSPPRIGALAKEWVQPVNGDRNELSETAISLAPALGKKGYGQVVVFVMGEPVKAGRRYRPYVLSWVQVTDLGVYAATTDSKLHAFVTRLVDGKAVSGAKVLLVPSGASAATGAKGLAVLPLPAKPGLVLKVSRGGDRVILPGHFRRRTPPGERVAWFVFDDRKLYKPGETVRLKGWIRQVNMGPEGGIALVAGRALQVRYQVFGPRRNKVAEGSVPVGRVGGFHLSFKLPDNVNLGQARVRLTLVGGRSGTYDHYFQVQEFKRPEFEVSAEASPGPLIVGGHADVAVHARYFAGGGLANARVRWQVTARPGYFQPPGWRDYHFGGSDVVTGDSSSRRAGPARQTQRYKGVTDGKGTDRLRIYFDRVDPPRPMSVQVSASVQDVSRRSWTAEKRLVVHPAQRYVGLHTDQYYYQKGVPMRVQVVAVDLAGKPQPGAIVSVQAVRLQWRYHRHRWTRQEVGRQTCRVAAGRKPVACTFQTPKGGLYVLRARVSDAKGRSSRTVLTRWVSGGRMPPVRTVKQEKVTLVAAARQYQPGQTAKVLLMSPFWPAEGVLTVRRSGILRKRRFALTGPSTTLDLPVTEADFPGISLHVYLAGSAQRAGASGAPDPKLPRRPAFAVGSLWIPVPPLSRELSVALDPRPAKLAPGGRTVLGVTVTGAKGKPVPGAQVALVAVDESVLALTGYKLSSPISTFYPRRRDRVRDWYLRQYVKLLDPLVLARMQADRAVPAPSFRSAGRRRVRAPAGVLKKEALPSSMVADQAFALGKAEPVRQPPIRVRKDFSPLAVFAPEVKTDAQGRATLAVKLPDNLTRYRVMAVAVARATLYGYGEASVTAQQPLMIRPQPPRFLNYGDRFWFPVVVQNQSDRALDVAVAVRGSNVRLSGPAGVRIQVPAGDRREVRFAMRAAEPGTARIQVAAASAGWADAAERKLPVYTPATTEAFATYGAVDQGAVVQPVTMPKGVIRDFGGLEVSTASTALSALTDALIYVYRYPYGCSEQIASRVISVAALRDVLDAFHAAGLPPKAQLEAAMGRDIRRLETLQNADGGWAFWRRFDTSWPFLTVHVTHALLRAKAKGYGVPEKMLRPALRYLRNIEQHIPPYYSRIFSQVIRAYALYVRRLAGDVDGDKARALYAELKGQDHKPLEAVAWLYPVLSAAKATGALESLRRTLANRVTETAGAAHFRTGYSDSGYLILYSDRRIDALLLEGLMEDQGRSDLIPKIVRGLLAHRTRGRWGNTQETVWVLLALDKYFHTYEKVTPDFVARLWLGDRYAGQHRYAGRTTDQHLVRIPMALLGKPGKSQNVILAKQGPGRLYYRIGMRYAPADLRPPPADHGFTVQRRYEGVDDPKDVTRLPDGTWQVKAGARVRVVLTLVAEARRYHVALVDPLPAGLEPINTSLRGAAPSPPGKAAHSSGSTTRPWRHFFGYHRYGWGWRWRWYQHQNLRDERAEAFTAYLPAGVYTYTYTARALTPGTFVVPPPKAEEMYHPETFGRGAGDRLVVK